MAVALIGVVCVWLGVCVCVCVCVCVMGLDWLIGSSWEKFVLVVKGEICVLNQC